MNHTSSRLEKVIIRNRTNRNSRYCLSVSGLLIFIIYIYLYSSIMNNFMSVFSVNDSNVKTKVKIGWNEWNSFLFDVLSINNYQYVRISTANIFYSEGLDNFFYELENIVVDVFYKFIGHI
eukprot:45390_1